MSSQLDGQQILQDSYDESEKRIRVDAEVTTIIPGPVEVAIDATADSIKIGNGEGDFLAINPDGSINVNTNSSDTITVVQPTGTDLHAIIDSGNITIDNAAGVSAVNIQDGGNSITVDGTISVTQGTSPWIENISQFGGSNVVTGTGNSGSGIPRVTISNDSSITNISGTISLPTGAATETSLTKLTQTQGSTTSGQSGTLIQGAVTTNVPSYTTGQTNPISLNTRGSLRVKHTGLDSIFIIRNDYSTTNVTTATYVQLIASTTNEVNKLYIFDSSGQDLVLATGAAASEIDQIAISQGGWDCPIDLYIPSGTRISVKSKSATANQGILLITGLK